MDSEKSGRLREKAKKILEKRGIQNEAFYTKSLESLIEELNIYQIELEQQNEQMRKTQLELQENRQRFVDLFENAPTGYFILQDDYKILQVNYQGSILLNANPDKIVGTPITHYIAPDHQDTFYFHLKKALQNDTPVQCELAIKALNNNTRYVRLLTQKEQNGNSEHKIVRIAMTDITETYNAYQQMQQSEEKYRAIFENSGEGFFVFSDTIEDCNEQATKMFGYSKQELIGLHPAHDLSPEIQPDNKNSYNEAQRHIEKATKKGHQQFQWQHRRKDGSFFEVEITLSMYQKEPKTKLIAIIRDISSQKEYESQLKEKNEEIAAQNEEYASLNEELNDTVTELQIVNKELADSEHKFRNYIDASPTTILILNDSNEIVYANNSAAELTGYSEDELAGSNATGLFVDSEQGIIKEIKQNKRIKHRETSINSKKKGKRNILLSATILEPDKQTILYIHDITKQKQLDRQVFVEKEQWRRTFQAVSDGIYLIDRNFQIILCNPAFASVTGHKNPDELLGARSHYVLHGLDHPKKNCPACRSVDSKKTTTATFYEKHLGKYVRTTSTPVLNHENEIAFYVNTIQDITAQKEYEKAIEQNRKKYESLFNSNRDAIIVADSKRQIIDANGAMENLFGYSRDKILSVKTTDLYSTPEEYENMGNALKNDKQKMGFRMICLFQKSDGTAFTGDVSIFHINNYNKQTDVHVALIRDITKEIESQKALVDSEMQLQLALEGAYEGMWDWNIKTGHVTFNHIWAEMLGYTLEEIEPNVNTWKKLMHPGDYEYTMHAIQAHLDGKSERYENEHRLRTKSGQWKWILDRGQVVERDANGNPVRAIGTHLDISRQKHTEEELKTAKERAEHADRLKSAFLANMSHEIRTPMNGIVGFTELLRKKELSETKRNRIFRIIQSSSKQLLQLINDIVDISKIEANQLTIYKEKFCLNELLKEIHEQAKLELQNRGKHQSIDLLLDIPDIDKKFPIYSSSTRMQQILHNLLSNAMKFTEEGYIKFGYKASHNNKIKLFVEDTGVGISEKAKEIIFERFMQAEPGTAKKYGGTGLGLFITRQLVNMLNGAITVESEHNKGSKFIITLPVEENIAVQ